MKTNSIRRVARIGALAITLALFGGFAGQIQAQEKGATRLLKMGGSQVNPEFAPSNLQPMTCANCKDVFVRHVDRTARGAYKPTVVVVKHLCESCATTWTTVGHGKAQKRVATHTCAKCSEK